MAQEQVQASEQKTDPEEPKQHPYRQPSPLRDRFSCFAASPSSEHIHPLPMSLRDGSPKYGYRQAEEQE
ncbi:hypothetical protein ARGLB_028_00100 [Arthrobacter globiformis NBRC 12137]|uniref:Uncharacterized protein n=1 Tax=Arthrobacter globiformis (strain ATCC 8010 / DSM 20124 / JCM 1332 / NBRC 12137 / NCIMB 8907 / NRRL B-2979 / 168) TaxID=1077972 RepID=H0QJ84_ARTG1|nr:hypothetical protein [Arthrobacter globiformis]GAB12885.1 hypothetical protein ARGLB_028_00100 [Arthrobacter globiformis NBRC 12137]